MSLAHGRTYLAIPGPSVMPDRVLQAMHRASPNIYEGELLDLIRGVIPDLKAVARTAGNVAMYIGNGHAAWEAAIANVLAPGDRVLALSTGRFCEGWAEMARRLGIEVDLIDFGLSSAIDLDRAEALLRADTGAQPYKAVLAVQVDTATSVLNDVAGLRKALDGAGHDALLMIDCIACLGVDAFEMDAWGVDVMVTGSQKGLMTPPGMAFVFASEKAERARAAMDRVSSHWDWSPRFVADEPPLYFGGTPPVHHLFALREAMKMLVHEEGVEAAWQRHTTLAQAVWTAFDAWAHPEGLALNVKDPSIRSHAVTAASAPSPKATQLRQWLEAEAGVTLGIGLGMAPQGDPARDGFFRVGHMGHINPHMVLGVLASIEAGLHALKIPFAASGVAAASGFIGSSTSPVSGTSSRGECC